MIHGYPKLKNMKQTAELTKQTLGIATKATYTAAILEFFGELFLKLLHDPHGDEVHMKDFRLQFATNEQSCNKSLNGVEPSFPKQRVRTIRQK